MDFWLMQLPVFMLVLIRMSGIFIFAPTLSTVSIPVQIKAMLVLMLSLCVYPIVTATQPGYVLLFAQQGGLSLWALPALVLMELSIGAVIGYGAMIPLVGMQMAGHIADQQLGTGLAGIFNPDLEEESSVAAELYFIFALTLFVILGGHRLLVGALIESFQAVPPGGFRPDGQVLAVVLAMLRTMVQLALQVSAPLLCMVYLETVTLGFIARTVPQMNILSVGFPIRSMLGLSMMAAGMAVAPQICREHLLLMGRQVTGLFSQ